MKNKTKLKCCPFCGGNSNIGTGSFADDVYFYCCKCGAYMAFVRSKDDLIESINAYNKRASDNDSDCTSYI